MAHTLRTDRRGFLKGAASAVSLAALYGTFGHPSDTSHLSPFIGVNRASAQAYPANKMSASLPEVTREITLTTPHTPKEIAPGLIYEVWSFEGSGPGPHLHVRQGETVRFMLKNTSDMTHSIDFHAAQLPWDRYYQAVEPGATLEFEWTPNFPGAFMYHCGTPPVLTHISNGMHGAIIVQPENGWAEPAREYVLVQHEWYLGAPNAEGIVMGDTNKMNTGLPDLVCFNGYFNQYQAEPLTADPGELVRIHIVNCGPTLWSAFHVIGALFEAAYPDGNPANKLGGMQTVSVPPGGGYAVELRIPDAGLYPFVTHSFAHTGRGALGVLKIGEPETTVSTAGH